MLNLPLPSISEALLEALRSLDSAAASAAIEAGQLRSDDVLATYHRLQLEEREGTVGSSTVAAATSLSRQLLRGLEAAPGATPAGSLPEVANNRVVVTSPAGGAHQLDVEAVASALRADGWTVDLLSGVAGEEDLIAFLQARPAVAVVVVCALSEALPEAARALWAAQRSGAPVLLAGPGFGSQSDDLRPLRLGADGWAPDLASAVEVIRRWATVPPVSSGVAGPPDEYLKLADAIPFTLQATSLVGPATVDRQLLRSLFQHLEAAVVVDDSRILLDFVRGEWSARQVQERDGTILVRLVDAVSSALPETLERSRMFMEDAKRYLYRVLPPAATAGLSSTSVGGAAVPPPVAVPSPPNAQGQGLSGAEGRVFSDLLMLGAMACEARTALVSVPRGGRWSTLSYGADRGEQVGDPALLEFLSANNEIVEVGDLLTHPVLSSSALPRPPLDIRWLIGIALRGRDGGPLGVMCIMDRRRKELTKSQGKAVLAIVRQLETHLEQWRRPSSAWGAANETRPAPSAVLNDRLAARRGPLDAGQQLLRSHEVASLFDVTERTVINWAASGKLPALRTIGGHLRFRGEDVASLLDGRSRAARSG